MHKRIRKIVHQVRQKPERDRRDILHAVTLAVAIIMVVLWTFTLGKNLKAPEKTAEIQNDLESFSVLKERLLEGYSAGGEKLPVITDLELE